MRHFSVFCSCKTRNNGKKLEHGKFHTNMWKSFMIKVVETPSLEIFKTHLDLTGLLY